MMSYKIYQSMKSTNKCLINSIKIDDDRVLGFSKHWAQCAKYRPATQQFLVKYQCMFHLKVRSRWEKTFHWISFPKVTKISKIENSWKTPPPEEKEKEKERKTPLIGATTLCLQHPRAAHTLSSEQLGIFTLATSVKQNLKTFQFP